jgi:2-hydroxy-3-oxopropionate reductase
MNTATSLPSIAFLGIGLMGAPMAARLLRAGYPLTAWNRTRAKAEALAAKGAQLADHPAEAVADADIIITMLEAGPVVIEVVQALSRHMRAGALLIDMSSTGQSEAKTIHAMLAAQHVGFIDAPVSGGVIGAQAGSLAIMAGAMQEDFDRAAAILSVLGRPVRVGPVGCGQLAKLCNQLIVGATLEIVAEALLLAQAGGADPVAVRAAIRGGFAESRILEVHGQRMLDRNFLPGGQVKSQAKDMENVMRAAADAGLRLPLAESVTESYRRLAATEPHADQSAVLLDLERINAGRRLGAAEDKLP